MISKIYQKKLLTPPPQKKKQTKQNRQTNKAQTIKKIIMRSILLPFDKY